MGEMKLYVWASPYPVPYGSSMVFAIAKSLEAAKKQASIGASFDFGDGPGYQVQNTILGEPTRIVSLPCAEWHAWTE